MTGSLIIAAVFALASVLGALILAMHRDAARTKADFSQLQQRYNVLFRAHLQEVENVKTLRREVESLKPKKPRVIT